MLNFLFAFAAFPLASKAGYRAPCLYARFTDQHSFCRPPSPNCEVAMSGIQAHSTVLQILDLHNRYRSIMATGQERRGGHEGGSGLDDMSPHTHYPGGPIEHLDLPQNRNWKKGQSNRKQQQQEYHHQNEPQHQPQQEQPWYQNYNHYTPSPPKEEKKPKKPQTSQKQRPPPKPENKKKPQESQKQRPPPQPENKKKPQESQQQKPPPKQENKNKEQPLVNKNQKQKPPPKQQSNKENVASNQNKKPKPSITEKNNKEQPNFEYQQSSIDEYEEVGSSSSGSIFQTFFMDNLIRPIMNWHKKFRRSEPDDSGGKRSYDNEENYDTPGFGPASNMLQLVWDDELAVISQKWADLCCDWILPPHEPYPMRATEHYMVGQNVCFEDNVCAPGQDCSFAFQHNWPLILKIMYDEVIDVQSSLITGYFRQPHLNVGHFVQLMWARTWRVGCGFSVVKKSPNEYRKLYICNYGPASNVVDQPVWKSGPQCSGCPANTCCDGSCREHFEYPGLCKMLNNNEAPAFQKDRTKYIFFCDFARGNNDCQTNVRGAHKWEYQYSLETGQYMSLTMMPGEQSAIFFQPVQINGDVCILVTFRNGPVDMSRQGPHAMELFMTTPSEPGYKIPWQGNVAEFYQYNFDRSSHEPLEIGFGLSVEYQSEPYVLDIQEVKVFTGRCDSRPKGDWFDA